MNGFVIWNSIQHNSKSIANFAIITRKNPVNSQKHDSKTQSAKVELKLTSKTSGFCFLPLFTKSLLFAGGKIDQPESSTSFSHVS